MSRKIGEVLIEQGLIGRTQLETALKAQLIYGGHLGTCLLELGMVDEDSLGRVLSDVAGVPYAPPSVLQGIPESTIRSLPRSIAEEYYAIPLKLASGTLHIAMVNPRNPQALEEISHASGHRVVPWVAPEIRILQGLETYFRLARRPRYTAICQALDLAARQRAVAEQEALSQGEPASPTDKPQAKRARRGPSHADGSPGHSPETPGEILWGQGWRDQAQEDLAADAAAPADRASSQMGSGARARSKFGELAERLCRAESRQEAVAIVLDFAAATLARTIVFGADAKAATIWDSRGIASSQRAAWSGTFSLTSEALFELAMGDGHYRGFLPADPRYQHFFGMLELAAPAEVILIPIHLEDRLVAIFYGDGGPKGSIEGETDDYLRLLRLFTLCLNLILMKQKIRAVAGFSPESRKPRPPQQPL